MQSKAYRDFKVIPPVASPFLVFIDKEASVETSIDLSEYRLSCASAHEIKFIFKIDRRSRRVVKHSGLVGRKSAKFLLR